MKITPLKPCVALLAAFAAILHSGDEAGARPMALSVCKGPDAYSNRHLAFIQGVVTSTETKTSQWRALVQLPNISDTLVTLVADSTTCATALAAYNDAADLEGGPAADLYLIRVGPTRYVASNPAFPSGEFVSQFVFDSAFALKATYLK